MVAYDVDITGGGDCPVLLLSPRNYVLQLPVTFRNNNDKAGRHRTLLKFWSTES